MTSAVQAPTQVAPDMDPWAERVVLSACLNDPAAIAKARRTLAPESFGDPANGVLFTAMLAVDDANQPVSPFSVYERLAATQELRKVAGGALIHDVWAWPYVGVPHAIGRVGKLARQRGRVLIARRFAQIADDIQDPDDAADAWAKATIDMEAVIDDRDESEPVPGLSTWEEFLSRPPRPSDSVIPGLLDRQEVVMILAAPGAGKSWLSRQVALTVASGTHPFWAGKRIPPMRTLLIDLENPESTVQRQTQEPFHAITRLAGGELAGDRGHIWSYPGGINIRKRPDAALLERVVDETKPDLVCIGSLYNLFQRGSSDWDTAAEETIAVLNKIRARQRCALWIEHHMPRGNEGGHKTSPFGSSMWERWPAYGRIIQRIDKQFYEFVPFRGDREAGREFPVGLKRGGRLPWSPIWDLDELEQIKQDHSGGPWPVAA